MSKAEIAAHQLYDAMQLDKVSDEVKKHLMILILSGNKQDEAYSSAIHTPVDYREALQMGAMDIEMAREELHDYIDELSTEFSIK